MLINYAMRVAMLPGMIAGNLHTAQTSQSSVSKHQTQPAQSRRTNPFNNPSTAPLKNRKEHVTFHTAPTQIAAQFSNIEPELVDVPLESANTQSPIASPNNPSLQKARPAPKNLQTQSSSCKSSCSIQ